MFQLIDRFEAFHMETVTPEQWAAEIWSGWRGPNGSSYSLDTILGVRIGLTTREYTAHLPANLHDARYRVARRLRALGKVSAREAEWLRTLADLEHRKGLRQVVAQMPWYLRPYGYANVELRHMHVRRFASFAVQPRLDERYMALEVIE